MSPTRATLLAAAACAALAAPSGAEEPTTASMDARQLLSSAARAGTAAPAGWSDRQAKVEIDANLGGDSVRQRRAKILEQAGSDGELATFTELLEPSDVNGTRILEQWSPGKSREAWVWSPATRRTQRMADDVSDDSSYYVVEASYRDAQLLDALPRLASQASEVKVGGKEQLDGVETTILDVTLSEPKALPGSIYRVWLATGDRSLRRIDVLDASGNVKRRVAGSKVEQVAGNPTAMEIEVSSPGTDRRSVFRRSDVRYDADLPTRTWSLANLSKGR